jgi:hypothetical protein
MADMISYYASLAYKPRPESIGDPAVVQMVDMIYNDDIWGTLPRNGPADEKTIKASILARKSDLVVIDIESWTINGSSGAVDTDQKQIDKFREVARWCGDVAPEKKIGFYGPAKPADWQNYAYPWMAGEVYEYLNGIWRCGFDRLPAQPDGYAPLVPGGVWGVSDVICPHVYSNGTERKPADYATWVDSTIQFCQQFDKPIVPFFDISKITEMNYPTLVAGIKAAHARRCIPLLWGGWDDQTGAMTFRDDLIWLRLLKEDGPRL